jgi:hypothetical protein
MKLRTFLPIILISLMPSSFQGQDRSYARSMVINDGGIVATSHTLASQAGHRFWREAGPRWTRQSRRMPFSV